MAALVDKVLNFVKMNPDDEIDDEDFDEEEDGRGRRGRSRYDEYDNGDDDDDYEEENESSSFAPRASLWGSKKASAPAKAEPVKAGNKKISLADPGQEVRVFKPTNLDEARKVTDTLLTKQSAILNLEGLDIMMAQRIIDFVGGSNYALHGHFTRISSFIFLFTPADVDIAGDIAEETMAAAAQQSASGAAVFGGNVTI